MRTNHKRSSWQTSWQRRGNINVVSFNTSSKSKKNWNGKQIQFSIHYFITLGEDSYEHTLPHLVSWSINEVTSPAPTQNHHKNIHSMSSYCLISQNALAVFYTSKKEEKIYSGCKEVCSSRVWICPENLSTGEKRQGGKKMIKTSWWSKAKNSVTLKSVKPLKHQALCFHAMFCQ